MSYLKNTASQKFNVLAVNTATGLPVSGDSANIIAKISIDSAAFASLTDTNPTELDATNAPGVYVFDLSQSETNGDVLTIIPSSSTANVQMDMLNIYTVELASYKADVSGLATAIALGVTDGKCTSILTDTGTTIPAQITALNDFDPASDTVANVTLVATTTTNTDMRGTDNAAAASSLSITNSSVNTIKGVTDNLPDSGALTSLATASALSTVDTVVDAILVDTGTTIPAQITALNNFDPASDAVANVTLVGTTTTNTDMRGTDSANTVAPANSDITAIKAKTDQFVFTVSNQVDANALTGGTSAADIYTYFTSGTNGNAFKATGFNTVAPDNASVVAIKSKTDQLAFTVANQVDSNALTGGGGDDAATIYTYFTNGTNEDAFKANLADLAGSGARTVTVTVNETGGSPIQNARVRVTLGAESYLQETDASGQVSYAIDDGTWAVVITRAGYSFTPTTLVVSDDDSVTFQMTQEAVPSAAAPGTTNAYFYAYDEQGAVAGVVCEATIDKIPSGSGTVFIPTVNSGTSSVTGLFQFPAYKGGKYTIRLRSVEYEIEIPTTASDPHPIGNLKAGK